jgi:hypothetical protein
MKNIFENLIFNLIYKATERAEIKYVVNKIFSGRQPRQDVKVFRRFGINSVHILRVCWWFGRAKIDD